MKLELLRTTSGDMIITVPSSFGMACFKSFKSNGGNAEQWQWIVQIYKKTQNHTSRSTIVSLVLR